METRLKGEATQREKCAQYRLGCIYEWGKGVPESKVMAHVWVYLTTANGLSSPKWHELLEKRLSQEDKSKALEIVRQLILHSPSIGACAVITEGTSWFDRLSYGWRSIFKK